jgi:hypothetical protein
MVEQTTDIDDGPSPKSYVSEVSRFDFVYLTLGKKFSESYGTICRFGE